jgi:hypothetical protein
MECGSHAMGFASVIVTAFAGVEAR